MKDKIWSEHDLRKRDEIAARAAESIATTKHPRQCLNMYIRDLLKYEIIPNYVFDEWTDDKIRQFAIQDLNPPKRLSKAANYDDYSNFPSLSVEQCIMLLIDVDPETPIRTQAEKDQHDRVINLAASYCRDGREPFADDHVGHIRNYQISPYLFVEWVKVVGATIPEAWKPTPESTEIIERRSAEARMVEVEDLPATTSTSILFYPIADGKQWVIGPSGSEKKIDQLAAFEDMTLAFRSPGVNVLEAIVPQAFTPTFGEEKTMDSRMSDQIDSEISDLTENIRIARKQGEHGELEKYEAELNRLNQFTPDSHERLNSGDAMISLTSSIRSRRTTAIRKIRDEFGTEFALLFEAYKVGNRHVTYQPNEPEPTWILDPPKT